MPSTTIPGNDRTDDALRHRRPGTLARHPVHSVLLVAAATFTLSALLADLAYANSYEVQWTNFASWLLVGAALCCGFALLWAVIDRFRADVHTGRSGLFYLGVLGFLFLILLYNNFTHAMDAWQKMPSALILSVIGGIAAIAALWLGLRGSREMVR